MCDCSPSTSWNSSPHAEDSPSPASPRRRCSSLDAIPGPATCASCKTQSSACVCYTKATAPSASTISPRRSAPSPAQETRKRPRVPRRPRPSPTPPRRRAPLPASEAATPGGSDAGAATPATGRPADAVEAAPTTPESTTNPATFTLPEEGLDLRAAVEQFEYNLIAQALERTGGNKNQASRL
ncbi:MAG: helix-turn-helix domain-containing protein, partial [Nannocystaceae bacterium]